MHSDGTALTQGGGFMSAPCGSSEQADGLKEGFEEEREFQEFHNDKLIEPYGGLLGSRQKCTEFYASGISRWSALRH